MSRETEFTRIKKSFTDCSLIDNSGIFIHGDSLSELKKIPNHSVSLILTDPPYHSTKKKNIYGDRAFEKDEHYLEWLEKFIIEWKRILKPNGSLYLFCSPTMAAKIEILFSKEFNILSHIVWTKPNEPGFDGWKQKMNKEALRQWYSHSERIIFCEPACETNLKRSPFGQLLREKRLEAGLTSNKLTELIGAFDKVNHGGAVSNWETGRNIPSKDQYTKIVAAILDTKKVRKMPKYEDAIRVFNVDGSIQFTDIWNFPNVRPFKGKHPAEKPLNMLLHIILASSFEGDIILDCFAGSGSTSLASKISGRKSISIEIEEKWLKSAIKNFEENNLSLEHFKDQKTESFKKEKKKPQLPLFASGE